MNAEAQEERVRVLPHHEQLARCERRAFGEDVVDAVRERPTREVDDTLRSIDELEVLAEPVIAILFVRTGVDAIELATPFDPNRVVENLVDRDVALIGLTGRVLTTRAERIADRPARRIRIVESSLDQLDRWTRTVGLVRPRLFIIVDDELDDRAAVARARLEENRVATIVETPVVLAEDLDPVKLRRLDSVSRKHDELARRDFRPLGEDELNRLRESPAADRERL